MSNDNSLYTIRDKVYVFNSKLTEVRDATNNPISSTDFEALDIT